MTRSEHLAWAKTRALACCDDNQPSEAISSMASDLTKHKETQDHGALRLLIVLKMSGQLETVAQVREFILGFN